LSLLLTHHFLLVDVDCSLIGRLIIPIITWLIALALGLFKSPFHICNRLTDGLLHALSSALLLFHARPWKHLPQLRHSFSSKGPTPSLSVDWWRHTPSNTWTLTHGLFIGDALLLFSSSRRHTPSSVCHLQSTHNFLITWRHTRTDPTHGPIPTHGEPSVAVAWRHTQQAFLAHREILFASFALATHTFSCSLSSATHAGINPLGDHTQRVFGDTQPEFFFVNSSSATHAGILLLLWLVYRQGLRLLPNDRCLLVFIDMQPIPC